MQKYLYLVLALVGLGLILAIPSHAASSTLAVTLNEVPSATIYPSQFDILVLDFTIKPVSDDNLKSLSIEIKGTTPQTSVQGATLYADDGDGIFQGWQKDISLGSGVFAWDYLSYQSWYWQNLDYTVKSSGQKLFIAIKTARNSNIAQDNKIVQASLPAFHDSNLDGIFDVRTDAGIFMGSGQNGPSNELLNNGYLTLKKTTIDYYAPESLITSPKDNEKVNAGQLKILGLAQDQGGGSISDIFITIKNSQQTVLVDQANGSITDYSTGAWQYFYEFSANGSYTIVSQAKDNNGNLESPGDSVIFTIGTPVIPPVVPPTTGYAFGDLIKASGPAVYYYGNDAKRYVFPNLNTYNSWYADFSTVKTITDTELASIAVGGNVTYRPGVKLVKIESDPKVYAVDHGGTLRWVTTEALAISLYGANWASLVEDVSVTLFIVYPKGSDISSLADYSPTGVRNAATSINVDKGL